MRNKDKQIQILIELRYQKAQAQVANAKSTCWELDKQIAMVKGRRNSGPVDPGDQINHERHIGWLDQRNRELTILAAQAAAEYNIAKDLLRVEFGRKAALSKVMKRQTMDQAKRASRQLS